MPVRCARHAWVSAVRRPYRRLASGAGSNAGWRRRCRSTSAPCCRDPLLVHGGIPAQVGQRSVIPGGQAARLRVTALDRVRRRSVVLEEGGDERARVAVVIRVRAIGPGKQPVLKICLNPGTRSRTRGEPAPAVHVGAAGHHVLPCGWPPAITGSAAAFAPASCPPFPPGPSIVRLLCSGNWS